MESKPSIVLENGLDLREVLTTGSILHINEDYAADDGLEDQGKVATSNVDFIGQPVKSFAQLEKSMTPVDATGFVKKKILEEGGGLPLHKGCTVFVAFSGYWENEPEPFDVKNLDKPLVVDLSDSGLLPGLQIAIETMFVGEVSVFLLSHQVMYGELGIPPRIKPKATSVFYIKLIKSILTPTEKVDYSEPNTFQRLYHEVKLLYASGAALYKSRNYMAAINLFRKAVYMLHRCRLADESEEEKQEKMLKKLYTNLAICYNATKQPLKACVACNEMNRLNSLWNNGKVLFQNAKALRMIGQYDDAEKKLRRAIKLCPTSEEIKAELELLQNTRESCNQARLVMENPSAEASDAFKKEVDDLIKNFKENVNLCKLTLPGTLNSAEVEYIKTACARENLFYNKIQKDFALDKDEGRFTAGESNESESHENLYESMSLISEAYSDSIIDVCKSEP
ncbi:FKBP-type peptidyl-prolyl cis-trans isomerase domain-containing protein [Phthorimaea operculella]|nr:FKBP-type peptidyl-prolyl cis-trans isomerase domain-containing protein [Phthorimaea operculella]